MEQPEITAKPERLFRQDFHAAFPLLGALKHDALLYVLAVSQDEFLARWPEKARRCSNHAPVCCVPPELVEGHDAYYQLFRQALARTTSLERTLTIVWRASGARPRHANCRCSAGTARGARHPRQRRPHLVGANAYDRQACVRCSPAPYKLPMQRRHSAGCAASAPISAT